jgi:hypothetical protein
LKGGGAILDKLERVSFGVAYEVDSTFDSDKFIKMRLRICHDGENPNKSSFEVGVFEDAKDSIKNIPVLANVIFDEDGNPQFSGHDIDIEEDKVNEGESKIVYKETPIGVIPENCNYEIKEFDGKNYVYCDAYIWREYSNYAEDIIERDKDVKLSMEILVDSYNYDGKKKVFNIKEFRYQGITFLNKDYGTGMKKALATTEVDKSAFIMMMEELNGALSDKGGNEVDERIAELLKTYGTTVEELDFDIEGMTYEEVETKLKPELFVKSFELSHGEIRYALYKLLQPVESEDSEWYFIDTVYNDKFEYTNWDGTKIYRQHYKSENDLVEFDGERIEVFQERLTKEEKDALDKMRAEFSEIKAENAELTKFKAEVLQAQREQEESAIFSKYDELIDVEDEAYSEIKKNKANFTIEQLKKEIAFIYAEKKITFTADNKIIKLGGKNKDEGDLSPYGNLFEKYNIKINKEDI